MMPICAIAASSSVHEELMTRSFFDRTVTAAIFVGIGVGIHQLKRADP